MIEDIRKYLKLEYGLGLFCVIGIVALVLLAMEQGSVADERAELESKIVETQGAQPARLDERNSVAEQLSQLNAEVQVLKVTVLETESEIGTRRDALAVIGDITDYITDREMDVSSFNSEEVAVPAPAEGDASRAIRYSVTVHGTASELTGLVSLSEQTPNAVVKELAFNRLEDSEAVWEIVLVFDVPFI